MKSWYILYFYLVNDDSNINPKEVKINYGSSIEVQLSCYSSSEARWYYKREIKDENAIRLSIGKNLILYQHGYKSAGYYYCYGLDYYTNKEFIAKSKVVIIGTVTIISSL